MRSDFVSALFFFFFDPLFCADRNYSQGDSLFKEFFTLAKELRALRTQSGFGLSVSSLVQPVAAEIVILHKPRWDSERRKFWLDEILIKAFRRSAPMVELILTAFQEEAWTDRIDDPLAPLCNGNAEPNRLRNQVQALNRCLDSKFICFSMDGTGQGICWQLAANAVAAP